MNNLKYFIQYILIIFLLLIFKLLGIRYSRILSGKIFTLIGPLFRSNELSHKNLLRAFPKSDFDERKKILKKMWTNYGYIFSEYMFIKNFRNDEKLIIENQEGLEKIIKNSQPVIFISGHFSNFELMAMHLEKSGIDLAAIYRPLNNKYLNKVMEKIRKKYICKKQIKKGISGTKNLLKSFKKGTSVALMIDQRVSEGIKCNFFNAEASTTTIPAQFVKKFGAKVVPIYIERIKSNNFKLVIHEPISFSNSDTINYITLTLNKILEKMIIKNPTQWIWTHNRWK
tara:strand:+ start:454 stop:1305 length:852 start_codon:yes stop_codon:yes gene_type:complete